MLVVRRDKTTLRLIHQPDHARLSSVLAQRWRRPQVIPAAVWPRLIDAVGAHDEGWRDAERSPALDAHGRPHSFKTLPIAQHVDIWRRGVAAAMCRDTYVGLIIALHARWLYTELMRPAGREETAAAQAFTEELDQGIDAALRELGQGADAERAAIEPHALLAARRLTGALDALSLMLCGALPFGAFPEPICFGSCCHCVVFSGSADGAIVSPWPFDSNGFEVGVEAREVADRPYADAAELSRRMAEARVVSLRFAVVGDA